MIRASLALVAVIGSVALAGCTSAADEARDLAGQACALPAPEAPNFDPDTADYGLLVTLADVARQRADLAQRAAEADDWWQVLADATAMLASAAERIEEIRRTGGAVSEQLPPAVWDQIKYASDAVVVECRRAMPTGR